MKKRVLPVPAIHASRTRQNLANRAGASNLQSASGAKAEGAQAPYLTIYSAFPYEGRSALYIANVHTCTLGSRGWQRERAASKVDVRGRNRKQHLAPSIAALSVFTCHYRIHLPLPRSEPCSMAGRQISIGIRRDHLLAAHNSDHRVRCARTYRVLTTREETMIGS